MGSLTISLVTGLLLSGESAAGDELARWFEVAGTPQSGESFGQFVARVAQAQIGKPYRDPSQTARPEELRVDLESFECVSFLEASLAVARCGWQRDKTPGCFLGEVERTRYRDGRLSGYASRLHYLDDWIEDNARRGRLETLSSGLGGVPLRFTFSYMSGHLWRYPALRAPDVLAEIRATEARLSGEAQVVVPRSSVRQAESELADGDVVGIAASHAGILLTHAGFVVKGGDGRARLLHASSYHGRVVLTHSDISDYVLRRPERNGIVVARPKAPKEQGS